MKLRIDENRVLLNRKQFLEAKRMDHTQMNGFLTNLYQEGIQEGERQRELSARVENLKIRRQAWEALIESLSNTKGIGEARKQNIKLEFRNNFSEEGNA